MRPDPVAQRDEVKHMDRPAASEGPEGCKALAIGVHMIHARSAPDEADGAGGLETATTGLGIGEADGEAVAREEELHGFVIGRRVVQRVLV